MDWQLGWLNFWENDEANEKSEKKEQKRKVGLFYRKLLQRRGAQKKMDRLNELHARLLEEVERAKITDQNITDLIVKLESVTTQGQRLSEQLEALNKNIRELREENQLSVDAEI